jgi:hypothetical protein
VLRLQCSLVMLLSYCSRQAQLRNSVHSCVVCVDCFLTWICTIYHDRLSSYTSPHLQQLTYNFGGSPPLLLSCSHPFDPGPLPFLSNTVPLTVFSKPIGREVLPNYVWREGYGLFAPSSPSMRTFQRDHQTHIFSAALRPPLARSP